MVNRCLGEQFLKCIFSVFELFNGFPQYTAKLFQAIDPPCPGRRRISRCCCSLGEFRSVFYGMVEPIDIFHLIIGLFNIGGAKITRAHPRITLLLYFFYLICGFRQGRVKWLHQLDFERRTDGMNALCAEVFIV
jgi:hypothetical protein